jgi:hypothetical protein
MATGHEGQGGRPAPTWPGPVTELPVLLSAAQVMALEAAARRRGLSLGALARRLLLAFLSQEAFLGHETDKAANRG